MSARSIRVAIVGGGVAGACLLHAILPLPHIDAHIFESAPRFKEAGVAFGIAKNARRALDLIGPSSRACLERAGGVSMTGSHGIIAQGEGQGENVMYKGDSTTIVQRANLVREFLDHAPPERMHASKKLVSVKRRADDSLLLHFADGSTHECDILIGADGVHSQVRRIVLGEDDPAAYARNSGSWAILTLNPYDQARASVGYKFVDINAAREVACMGRGSFVMTNLLNHGQTVQVAIASFEELPQVTPADERNQWTRTVTAEWLRDKYGGKGWAPHIEAAVGEIICSESTRQAISAWEHPHARTFVSGPICVFGDAAHTTTPHMGSGGGMCVEDCMIMYTLLARVSSPAEAVKALEVYDQIRRPRTQQVVDASLKTGRIACGVDKEIRLDAAKMRKAFDGRWDFILDHDTTAHRDEAIRLLDVELGKTGMNGSNGA